MRKDIIITANSKTSRVDLPTSRLGLNGENLQGNIIAKFSDEFVNGNAILVIQRDDEKYDLTMQKENESYYLPILSSLLTKATTIIMQIRITEGTSITDIPVWKSNKFYLKVEESINAEITIPEEYPEWIDIANAKLNEIDGAIEQIDNIDIDVEKVGNTSTVSITKKDGTNKSAEILDGTNGIDGDSIYNANISQGHLIITIKHVNEIGEVTLRDVDVGQVVGRDGTNGTNGTNGDGYKEAQINNSGELILKEVRGNGDFRYINLGRAVGQDGEDAKINGVNTLLIKAGENISLEQEGATLTINSESGTIDYSEVINKPLINGVVLKGSKSLNDLGIQPAGNYLTQQDIAEKEDKINKVTSISNESTNIEYPSAKCLYDNLLLKSDLINNRVRNSVANFKDGTNNLPVNEMIITIGFIQEGSGTPSVNNVRDIAGWNGAIINHSGEDTQTPEILNISWQNEAGTVYGGYLNITTGILTETHALLSLAISDMNNDENYPGWRNSGAREILGAGLNATYPATCNMGTRISVNTNIYDVLFLPKSFYNNMTQTAWKTQYPDYVFKTLLSYATPRTYQLTPHEIKTLYGVNNFWTNTGDTIVDYKADTKLYIDSKFETLEDRISILEG